MRKRRWYLALLGIAALAVFVGVLYDASTHVVRGWLRGEAFYDGRPTSYWRERCDEWLERFDSTEDAEYWAEGPMLVIAFKVRNCDERRGLMLRNVVSSAGAQKSPRPKGFISRTADRVLGRTDYGHAPDVLRGFPAADDVARELAKEPRFERMAKNALIRAEWYREARESILKEGHLLRSCFKTPGKPG